MRDMTPEGAVVVTVAGMVVLMLCATVDPFAVAEALYRLEYVAVVAVVAR